MIPLLMVVFIVASVTLAWHGGYWRARTHVSRAHLDAFRDGMAAMQVRENASAQRGYAMAHVELLERVDAIPKPRWWHAWWQPRADREHTERATASAARAVRLAERVPPHLN